MFSLTGFICSRRSASRMRGRVAFRRWIGYSNTGSGRADALRLCLLVPFVPASDGRHHPPLLALRGQPFRLCTLGAAFPAQCAARDVLLAQPVLCQSGRSLRPAGRQRRPSGLTIFLKSGVGNLPPAPSFVRRGEPVGGSFLGKEGRASRWLSPS